ncbi:Sulfate Permease (SulP) Family [Phytophthora cinnamomi]|uniref:Sulfate Permease (SulP) Family n=1 Tax=Phytophthora cinnamomi TaxID=4785 RepID=UPI00355ABE7D|nr:Sulfate Permease (SulP) Family [Phytophthora cinnamomi]
MCCSKSATCCIWAPANITTTRGRCLDPVKDPTTVSELLDLFDFSHVNWNQLPKQFYSSAESVLELC